MGKVMVDVSITNLLHRDFFVTTTALVDTGANFLTLPMRFKEGLGAFELEEPIEVELASGRCQGQLCQPVYIAINGGGNFAGQALFLPDCSEVLLGVIPLEVANLAIDVVDRRLVPGKSVDAKGVQ